ncbi:hypothetical protein IG611_16615 [Pectobacterium sp. A535-S3-A17]|uniref:hypothetical protein n=1 Tax=Pectobacterium quasiaquaticum TaxID=2774015 RepID=UPI001876345B|nr:hypothetical protein [Pectobacterium quasiaquaticum]MBE5212975.1 hypothetical protein [Pectobacterium quasiaquaticum]MBE5226965.1 hypothetical protein [Pectobacterium quasiaquaticum]
MACAHHSLHKKEVYIIALLAERAIDLRLMGTLGIGSARGMVNKEEQHDAPARRFFGD